MAKITQMIGPRCPEASRGPRFSPWRTISKHLLPPCEICLDFISSTSRPRRRLAFAPPVSQRFRIVGGADSWLAWQCLPCPHRDLALARSSILTRWRHCLLFPCGPADVSSAFAARRLDHVIDGDALRSLGAKPQRLQQVSIKITAAARESSALRRPSPWPPHGRQNGRQSNHLNISYNVATLVSLMRWFCERGVRKGDLS